MPPRPADILLAEIDRITARVGVMIRETRPGECDPPGLHLVARHGKAPDLSGDLVSMLRDRPSRLAGLHDMAASGLAAMMAALRAIALFDHDSLQLEVDLHFARPGLRPILSLKIDTETLAQGVGAGSREAFGSALIEALDALGRIPAHPPFRFYRLTRVDDPQGVAAPDPARAALKRIAFRHPGSLQGDGLDIPFYAMHLRSPCPEEVWQAALATLDAPGPAPAPAGRRLAAAVMGHLGAIHDLFFRSPFTDPCPPTGIRLGLVADRRGSFKAYGRGLLAARMASAHRRILLAGFEQDLNRHLRAALEILAEIPLLSDRATSLDLRIPVEAHREEPRFEILIGGLSLHEEGRRISPDPEGPASLETRLGYTLGCLCNLAATGPYRSFAIANGATESTLRAPAPHLAAAIYLAFHRAERLAERGWKQAASGLAVEELFHRDGIGRDALALFGSLRTSGRDGASGADRR